MPQPSPANDDTEREREKLGGEGKTALKKTAICGHNHCLENGSSSKTTTVMVAEWRPWPRQQTEGDDAKTLAKAATLPP
jgi:hypothetical protein